MKPWILTGDALRPEPRNFRWLGFAVAFVLLAAVAGLAYTSLARFRADIQWDEHTHEVIDAIDQSRSGLLSADSMRRAFKQSLDPADHAAMEARISEATRAVDKLGELVNDNPAQVKRVASLRPLMRERLEVMRTGLDLPRVEFLTPTVRDEQRAIQSRGTAIAKQMREVFDAMRTEELKLLGEREALSLASAQSTQVAILLGGALGLSFLAVFYFSLLGENRHRRRIQDELQRTNFIVSAVVESSLALIAVKDRQGRYLLANETAAAYLQRPFADVLGKTDNELMSPEAAQRVMADDRKVMETGEARVLEQELNNYGQSKIFLTTKSPYRDADGNVIGVIAISRDITDRKEMETRILEQNAERGHIISRMERQSAQMIALSEMGNFLQVAENDQEAFDVIGHCALRIFGRPGGLAVIAHSRNQVETVTTWGVGKLAPSYALGDCWALRTGRQHLSGPEGTIPCPHFDSAPGACIPLMASGEVRGVIHLLGEPLRDDSRALLAAFTEQVSLALANIQLRETLRSQAIRDPLTSLFNRRYMDETLAREIGRVRRKAGPLSVAMLDLDHFKKLNDTFGHAAGDAVLKELARTLLGSIRREDVACRYGGEEFVIILPEVTLEKAQQRAERWRAEVEKIRVELGGTVIGPLTASFGVATFPSHGATGNDLIAAADGALYQAKHEGRNCVRAASVTPVAAT